MDHVSFFPLVALYELGITQVSNQLVERRMVKMGAYEICMFSL